MVFRMNVNPIAITTMFQTTSTSPMVLAWIAMAMEFLTNATSKKTRATTAIATVSPMNAS